EVAVRGCVARFGGTGATSASAGGADEALSFALWWRGSMHEFRGPVCDVTKCAAARGVAAHGAARVDGIGTAGALVCGRFWKGVHEHDGRAGTGGAIRSVESRGRSGLRGRGGGVRRW